MHGDIFSPKEKEKTTPGATEDEYAAKGNLCLILCGINPTPATEYKRSKKSRKDKMPTDKKPVKMGKNKTGGKRNKKYQPRETRFGPRTRKQRQESGKKEAV